MMADFFAGSHDGDQATVEFARKEEDTGAAARHILIHFMASGNRPAGSACNLMNHEGARTWNI